MLSFFLGVPSAFSQPSRVIYSYFDHLHVTLSLLLLSLSSDIEKLTAWTPHSEHSRLRHTGLWYSFITFWTQRIINHMWKSLVNFYILDWFMVFIVSCFCVALLFWCKLFSQKSAMESHEYFEDHIYHWKKLTRSAMCLKCGFSVEILWKNCGSRVPQFFPFSTMWSSSWMWN